MNLKRFKYNIVKLAKASPLSIEDKVSITGSMVYSLIKKRPIYNVSGDFLANNNVNLSRVFTTQPEITITNNITLVKSGSSEILVDSTLPNPFAYLTDNRDSIVYRDATRLANEISDGVPAYVPYVTTTIANVLRDAELLLDNF